MHFIMKLARLNLSENAHVAITWGDDAIICFFELIILVKVGVYMEGSIPQLYYPTENPLFSHHLSELDFEYLGLIISVNSGVHFERILTPTADNHYLFLRGRNSIPKFV